MRGRKKFGRWLLLASAASVLNIPSSYSADLMISTERTTPVDTATTDGTGPGNITVQTAGAVTVSSSAAVTVNSSNTLSNSGSIINNQESNAVGVNVLTTNNITSAITNLGTISIPGPTSSSSAVATDVFNTGIKVSGPGTFTGNISNDSVVGGTAEAPVVSSGAIVVGGNGSSGILVQSNVIGSVINKGAISVQGNNTYGIATTGRITGTVNQGGIVTTNGSNSVGVYMGGGVDGPAYLTGSITSGTGPVITSTNGVTLITLDPLPAKAGMWIASDITQGLFTTGNRMTRSEEAANPTAAGAATPPDSSIAVVGSNALLITQGGLASTPKNIFIGGSSETTGFSIKNQGNILSDATVKGAEAYAINIHGLITGGVGYTTTLSSGIWNDRGNIETAATDGRAVGINIGTLGLVSRIQNDGDILVNTLDSTANQLTGMAGTKGGDAYGILVDSFGALDSFGNAGNLVVKAQGGATSAYGVIDRSGTLKTFINNGLINTEVQDGSTGKVIAVDLSANTSGVTFTNTGSIIGDVFLGSGNSSLTVTGKDAGIFGAITFQNGATKTGNNTFNVHGGLVSGLVNLGNGTHTVTLTNGALVNGGISQGTGTLSLSVDASEITLRSASPINASSAAFTGASTLRFSIDNSAATLPNGILQSTGNVSFGANSKITAVFTGLIDGTKTITAIRANSLTLGAPLSTIATSPQSYINSSSFRIDPTNPNTLLLDVKRKTATELGLGANRTAIYNAFTTALNQDIPVVTALSALQTKAEFDSALAQLLPDSSGALQQAALNNQDMAGGAIRRRLVGVAKNGMPDHAAGDVASFWAQALGDYSNQSGRGEQAGFDIWGLGIAFGADVPIFDNTTNIGIALAETWHSTNLQVAAQSPVEFYNTQANLYARYSGDVLYLQAIAGAGYNSYNQERNVTIGNVKRLAIGKWKGYEYGGSVEAGFTTRFSNYHLTPFVRASYLKNHENGYTEKSGGTGIDLTVAARNADNGRASAGFTIDRDFPVFYDSYIEAEFRANYTREFMNDPYRVSAQFAVGPRFDTFTNVRSPNRANVGVGVAHKDSYSSVSVDYDSEIASGYLAHKVAVTARFRF